MNLKVSIRWRILMNSQENSINTLISHLEKKPRENSLIYIPDQIYYVSHKKAHIQRKATDKKYYY